MDAKPSDPQPPTTNPGNVQEEVKPAVDTAATAPASGAGLKPTEHPQPNPVTPDPSAPATALEEGKELEQADKIPDDATETVYLNNLNEKVKLPALKQTLKNLLKNFGPVLDVVAHRSVRMRGQAFVAFADREVAARAVKEVKGFPLYGKPIVWRFCLQEIAFARSPADCVVKRKTPDEFEAHKAERILKKKRSRRENPLRKKAFAIKEATRKAAEAATAGGGIAATAATTLPASSSNRKIVQMPDEYQPPNKILFIQNLPENAGKDALEVLFKQFESLLTLSLPELQQSTDRPSRWIRYPNLVEVRTIPGRSNIAFVEYVDATSSGVAKDALHNYKFDGEHKIKVTFAKQ
ncbi:uncharacterized protein VP01_394g2 [Puccinia sorghi]|uniref:RRM domain-containing protein n=1 Tax=Puccinia sorghi TaxID=27349 RepID=A0A0L6UT98_9BASI|nr:uncharacterized protein VP01_394g2 [Puccinia sorghi]